MATLVLLQNGKKVLTNADKRILSKIISFQLIRQPEFINKQLANRRLYSYEVKQEIINQVGNKLTNKQMFEITRATINLEEAKDISFEAISNKDRLEKFSDILEEKIWLVHFNQTDKLFCTSDNPVIMYNTIGRNIGYRNNGVGRSDSIIYYPLSPYILIQILPRNDLWNIFDKEDSILRYLYSSKNNTAFVEQMNHFQEENADIHVIYKPEK